MSLSLPPRYRLVEKEVTGSTNTDALDLARIGAGAFTLVWAHEQTAARGRFNRKWIADRGNLYWSVILRPAASTNIESLVFVAALAIVDAVAPLLPADRRLEIKWPNDALIDDAKFSGTLIERVESALVVGIGINVLVAPDAGQTLYPATSIKKSGGQNLRVSDVCERLCASFARWYDVWEHEGLSPTIRETYLTRMWRLDAALTVSLDAEKTRSIEGINRGITNEGYLLLAQADQHEPSVLMTGDVLFGTDDQDKASGS